MFPRLAPRVAPLALSLSVAAFALSLSLTPAAIASPPSHLLPFRCLDAFAPPEHAGAQASAFRKRYALAPCDVQLLPASPHTCTDRTPTMGIAGPIYWPCIFTGVPAGN